MSLGYAAVDGRLFCQLEFAEVTDSIEIVRRPGIHVPLCSSL